MMAENDDTDIKLARPARFRIPRLTREEERMLDSGDDFGVRPGGTRGDDPGDLSTGSTAHSA